jgi:hypothetical protein
MGLVDRLSGIVRRRALFDLTLGDIDLPIRDTSTVSATARDATRVAPIQANGACESAADQRAAALARTISTCCDLSCRAAMPNCCRCQRENALDAENPSSADTSVSERLPSFR